MNQVQSTRPPRSLPEGAQRAEKVTSAFERLAERKATHASGFYVVVDEYAGLDRLDRIELDEVEGDS